jgi:hypothetical protein
MRTCWKLATVLLVAAGFSLGAAGCKSSDQSKPAVGAAGEQPKTDHPAGEHPKGEHPKGEHPK